MTKDISQNADLEKTVKDALTNAGFEIITDIDALFDGIKKLFLDPTLAEVINEEVPRILEAEPDFQQIYQIDLSIKAVNHAIQNYYTNIIWLANYETPEKIRASIEHSFKVYLRHVPFFMESGNHTDMLDVVYNLQEIFSGRWMPPSIGITWMKTDDDGSLSLDDDVPIPKSVKLNKKESSLLESYSTAYNLMESHLPFLVPDKLNLITQSIASYPDKKTRVIMAEHLLGSYLNEAREVALDDRRTIPEYYIPENEVTQYIKMRRDPWSHLKDTLNKK